ncbi:MAG: hypothetical protein JWN34_4384 [Bryobacterales bacterium]|nr:hypothetical protein [Bryobacterales bacterium]
MQRSHLFFCAAFATLITGLSLRAQSQERTSQTTFHLAGRGGSIAYPSGWSPMHYDNVHELWNATPEEIAQLSSEQRESIPRIETNIISFTNHAEAVRRLRDIEAEWGMTSQFLVVGGWPALQRRQLVPKPEARTRSKTAPAPSRLYMITTAIAAGNTLVRLDGFAPESAPPNVLDQIEKIGRELRPDVSGDPIEALKEVAKLRKSPSLRMRPATQPEEAPAGRPLLAPVQPRAIPASDTAGNLINLGETGVNDNDGLLNEQIGSESEIAVSTNGANIVVAQQCRFRNSTDGGNTFPSTGVAPGNCTGGDSSVAFGASGNFYWATIGSNNATCPATQQNCNNTQQMARSTTNGANFAFVTNVIDCRVTGGCGFGNVPDQEHIAADRVNASASGGDQIYLAFRKGFGYGIQCSTDSGANWTAVAYHTGGAIDFPRITVGQNGTVYVIANNGNNINIDSFSSCQNGLVQNLNQVSIAAGINQVVCPVPGLDRCNNGNNLSSHTVAVDDTNANHLYVSYSVNTVAPSPVPPGNPPTPLTTLGNENIMVQDSINGGANWRPAVQISQAANGRRYETWTCATGGTAFVSYFDRAVATTTSNDLTDYFLGSANLDGGGNLQVAGASVKLNGASDPECASGWPCSTRNLNDSESCSTQPQLAGRCRHTPNNNTDSFIACDSNQTTCPATETCQAIGNGGCPKYGDYTGNACLQGRVYAAFPSATNQPGATPTGGNISTFFSLTVVSSTGTTVTYTGDTTADYHDTANLSANLVLSGTSVPVVGQTLTFTLGTQTCSSVTNASGTASCSIVINQQPGLPYTVKASFAGSGNYQASSASTAFTITREQTTTTYTGPTVIANAVPTTFSAVLNEDGTAPIAGRTITITLGSGPTAQTCNGVTSATGRASCSITPNQPFGPGTVRASFAGDAFYLPSSGNANTILFAFLSRGAFVVGDNSDAGAVEFWGNNWSLVNATSGGATPNQFKGYAANTSEPPRCNANWITRPGNSSDPPDPTLPSYMGVIVSSRIGSSGAAVSGNAPQIVVVRTDPGYDSNPGHHGTGTVIATYCK